MKLYLLSSNPKLAAEWHIDSHVAGMCGVYSQAVANAYHIHESDLPATIRIDEAQAFDKEEFMAMLPQPHEEDHPVSRWVADTMGNFATALILADSLHHEYHKRFGKTIGTADIPVLCNKAMKSLPLYGDGTIKITHTPFPVRVRAKLGIKLPKGQAAIKRLGGTYLPIGDITELVRYFQDQYKLEVADEINRSKKRLKDLYTNRTPPPFLSSLEKIIIS